MDFLEAEQTVLEILSRVRNEPVAVIRMRRLSEEKLTWEVEPVVLLLLLTSGATIIDPGDGNLSVQDVIDQVLVSQADPQVQRDYFKALLKRKL